MKDRFRLAQAAVLFLIVVLFFGCRDRQNELEVPRDGDLLEKIIDTARWSQNAHNIQSWKIRRDDEFTFQGGLDASRLLPATDPLNRQLILSLGAFSEVARLKARSEGYDLTAVWIAPDDLDYADLPHRLLFEWKLTPIQPIRDAALDAISRATVKYAVVGTELPSSVIEVRGGAGQDGEYRFEAIDAGNTLTKILDLARKAYEIEMTNERTLMESFNYTRIGRRARDAQPYGITLLGNFDRRRIGLIEFLAGIFPQTPEQFGEAGISMFGKVLDKYRQVIVLYSAKNDPESQFKVGLPMQAMWLEALNEGVSLLPLSQGLQEDAIYLDIRTELHSLLARDGETIQMIWGVGKGDGEFLRSPRIPAGEIIQD